MGTPRKKYPKDFKLDAVRLVVEQGRSARSVTRDLGINESLLHHWKRRVLEDGDLAFSGKGRRAVGSDLEAENRKLREELRQAKQGREILKKAAAYFAKLQS